MSDEFEKRINLVCVAAGLKEADPPKLSSLAELERAEARLNSSSLTPDWMTALYSDTRDMVQSVPLPLTVALEDAPVIIVASLPPGTDPESVTATLYDGVSNSVVEVNVTPYGGVPAKGLNVFLREDIVGDYVVYVYSYNTSDPYLFGAQLQIRYKVQL